MSETYKSYENSRDTLRSAQVIVPMVVRLLQPKSVVDVGCGTGEFLLVFRQHGVQDTLGVDGGWINREKLVIPPAQFHAADLEKPIKIDRVFDLAVCLEVAEHLAPEVATTFVEALTSFAPVVLFSAAIPFQEGRHHVNEQWPEYWATLFSRKGFVPIDCFRRFIWNNEDVSFWYAQNMLLYARRDHIENHTSLRVELERTESHTLAMVHPRLYFPKAKKYDSLKRIFPAPIRRAIGLAWRGRVI